MHPCIETWSSDSRHGPDVQIRLRDAVEAGDLEGARAALRHGADPNWGRGSNRKGWTTPTSVPFVVGRVQGSGGGAVRDGPSRVLRWPFLVFVEVSMMLGVISLWTRFAGGGSAPQVVFVMLTARPVRAILEWSRSPQFGKTASHGSGAQCPRSKSPKSHRVPTTCVSRLSVVCPAHATRDIPPQAAGSIALQCAHFAAACRGWWTARAACC